MMWPMLQLMGPLEFSVAPYRLIIIIEYVFTSVIRLQNTSYKLNSLSQHFNVIPNYRYPALEYLYLINQKHPTLAHISLKSFELVS